MLNKIMKLITEVKVKLSYSAEDVLFALRKKCNLFADEIIKWEIVKESLDARKKPDIFMVLNVAVEVKKYAIKKVQKFNDIVPNHNGVEALKVNFEGKRPVIVGFGPAGMFAGLSLALSGLKPIILEQGKPVQDRQKDIDEFWKNRKLNKYSNVQFGEGGAGTFSDGKLASNVNNEYTKRCINEFVLNGAPSEIFYSHTPHIGSDKLKEVVTNIRKKIENAGGQVIFNTKFVGFEKNNQKLTHVFAENVETGEKLEFETNSLVLAIGHSAVETYEYLNQNNFELKQKPFAMGVRIEGLQEDINMAQYGKTGEGLPSANYKLVAHLENGRSVFTFCMCPGGTVVASSSEEGTIVTNGMSNYARDGKNANSAVLVNVVPEDFGSSEPLAGVYFQRKYEKLAFELGGRDYSAPAEKVKDFLAGTENFDTAEGKVKATYLPRIKFADLSKCLPDFVTDSLKLALPKLDQKVKGFADDDNLLIGVESRSSAPVQIVRDENFMTKTRGVFVCGEGAGYAGGITSSAADGLKCAEKVIDYLTKK